MAICNILGMTLDDYLKAKGISDLAAAQAIGIHRSTIAHLRTRYRKPSIDVAAKIERWTGGKVKAASFADPVP